MTAAFNNTRAYFAKWLWSENLGLKADAWVTVENGKIKEISGKAPQNAHLVDLGCGLLMPGLVNAHCHLELSFLAGLIPTQGDFMEWLDRLVNLRTDFSSEFIKNASQNAADFMAKQGTALVGDITNTGKAIDSFVKANLSSVSFFEALGASKVEPDDDALFWHMSTLVAKGIAAHSPYSVPAKRLKALKKRANHLPFCIHCAESEAETQYIAGNGSQGQKMNEFLEKRGVVRKELGICDSRPLGYLMALGLVDEKTLLVHGVQLEGQEIDDLAQTRASLCVCPRSNLGLTRKIAPVDKLLEAQVNLAIGTDSLSSTPDLSLLNETKALWQAFRDLSPESILNMATIGGAKALGLDDYYGRISCGLKACLAFVPLSETMGKSEILGAVCAKEFIGEIKRINS